MAPLSDRWDAFYARTPLCDVPHHFANIRRSPPQVQYLTKVLSLSPRGARVLEPGVGLGMGTVWLSLRGIRAEGIDYSAAVVERARQVNNVLGGCASFRVGDLYHLFEEARERRLDRYHVIHHQGVLEHFGVPWIHAALAQQVALAEWVVFSVPSVYYNCEPEFGDERLLPLEEWERILSPFEVVDLGYYGGSNGNDREHILCVLRGQPADKELLSLMVVPQEPFAQGITAIVHTRDEERHIGPCLQTLFGWTDQIVVCDMQSSDKTVEIASSLGAEIVLHPLIKGFDRARNVSAMRALFRWIFFLDADERVPPGLGQALRNLVLTQGDCFEAVHPPFKHYFAGHWMQSLYPGYTAPRLLKNGKFYFNPRLHSGAVVDGRTIQFPGDNPDLALVHHSYDSLHHYLEKFNRYTDGEAADMHRDGQPYHWQRAMRHFLQDFVGYYDRGRAYIDGPHGFIWSFQSAFYRFEQHAKLFEHRFRQGQLRPEECQVPVSVRQLFEFALSVLDEKPPLQATALQVVAHPTPEAASVVWSAPLKDPSGIGEDSRHLLFATQEAGANVAAQVLPWNQDAPLTEDERERLNALVERPVSAGFVQIVQDFPHSFARHPQAGVTIGRAMFETDRLPESWVQACNRMDFIWVPSEFNRQTFAQAGVASEKLVVIPGCFDPAPYRSPGPPDPLLQSLRDEGKFVFLSVFDWTRHKGWDVLLQGFIEAFEGRDDVVLVLKVWSTLGYANEEMQRQAMEFLKQETGHDLLADGSIRWRFERLSREEMIALYRGTDAFVLPSRGEGWGRPYMEAMACAVPTIGTHWSGNTAFMTAENSFLLDYHLEPVPESAWRELPGYRGHRWAEPDREHLKRQMRRIVEERVEARSVGERAREEVCERFSRAAVGPQIAAEIARVEELSRSHPYVIAAFAAASAPASLLERPTLDIPAESQEMPTEGVIRDRRSVSGRKSICNPTAAPPPLSVRWEGDFFQWHSLAHVNRELCLQLQAGGADLSLVPSGHTHFLPESVPRFAPLGPRVFSSLAAPVEVHVRHFFPPRLERPDEGRFVLMQPWEYGYLPRAWIEPIQNNVDEVWCYSRYVKEVYRASGIPESKLQVVPLGVDAETFCPEAPPYIFSNEPGAGRLRTEGSVERLASSVEKPAQATYRQEAGASLNAQRSTLNTSPFVFLFVGGTLKRKGIDILLEAYLRAFSAYDDVVLVIKDTGTQTVYRGQNEREQILKYVDDPSRPAVVYLDQEFLPHQLAGIYTAAYCLVQPYRGEGFCLPALEAMSCGRPVIVPKGGPTDDFVDETVGWLVDAERKPMAEQRVGPWDCVGPIWQFEIAVRDLAKAMRQAYANPQEVARRGQAARERVVSSWTWHHSGEAMLARLEALREKPRHTTPRLPILPVIVAPTTPGKRSRDAGGGKGTEKPRLTLVREGDPPSNPTLPTLSQMRSGSNLVASTIRKAPTISLCMIVRNEERVFGDCLASIKPFVDEIIVVDTGSTDRTIEIAEAAGAKVFHFAWCNDFSAARNVSLSHATCDWIVWLDADDTISEDCGSRLHEVVMLAEDRVTGFILQVHIPPAPGENGFTIVDHVKLFRNLPNLRFERRIHEQILEPINRMGGMIERTDLYVVHSGYDYSPEGQKKKRERDLTILELEKQERPDAFTWWNIGMTAFHLKDFEQAASALERCRELSKPHESIVRKVYAMLAGTYLERREMERSKERLEQGLRLFPQDPELLFRAGIIYRELGNLPAAEMCLLNLLHRPETGHIDSLDVSMRGYKAHHNLALIYMDLGRFPDAEAQWKAAVGEHAGFIPSWLGLGQVYLKTRRYEDALAVADRLAALDPVQAEGLRLQATRGVQ